MKLIRIFRRDDMQAKLQREFREQVNRPAANDISNFNVQFSEMRSLWMTRLCTSLEEHTRMMEQVETSGKRVKDLNKTLEDKKDQLDKFQKNAKELKEARRQEIENLKQARGELKNDKITQENQLSIKCEAIKESSEKRHQERMRELAQNIDELKAELKMVQDMNSNAEKQLLQQYDGADKLYTEALDQYDNDMREKNKDKEETLVDCQE